MTTPTSIAKPVIAAVIGACAGIGLIAAVNCDLRFASATAARTRCRPARHPDRQHDLEG